MPLVSVTVVFCIILSSHILVDAFKISICTSFFAALRLLSISDGVDALPCSIVLTRWEGDGRSQQKEEAVVGHARLMPVAGNSGGAFVESGEAMYVYSARHYM